MTCSSGTKRSPSGITTKRGSSDGTLTRAKRRSRGDRVAQHHGQVERQVRDVRERMPGIDGERREHREDALLEDLDRGTCGRPRRARPSSRSRCRRRPAPAPTSSRNSRSLPVGQLVARRRGPRAAAAPGVRPSGVAGASPAATWSLRPATRTWKNSSRFWLKMARNLARSSSGTAVVRGQGQHPRVEVEPGQLAVDEALVSCLQRLRCPRQARIGHGGRGLHGGRVRRSTHRCTTRHSRPSHERPVGPARQSNNDAAPTTPASSPSAAATTSTGRPVMTRPGRPHPLG